MYLGSIALLSPETVAVGTESVMHCRSLVELEHTSNFDSVLQSAGAEARLSTEFSNISAMVCLLRALLRHARITSDVTWLGIISVSALRGTTTSAVEYWIAHQLDWMATLPRAKRHTALGPHKKTGLRSATPCTYGLA